MDGYVITATAEEAYAAWGSPGVRHAAELDTGEGLLAFVADVPPAAGVVFVNDDDAAAFWFPYKIRKLAPTTDHDPETFGLYTAEAFRALSPLSVQMASPVGMGLVLAMTYGKQSGATWQAEATRYLDVRVPLETRAYA